MVGIDGLENVKVRLSSGRSVSMIDLFRFVYQLSEIDIIILRYLIKKGNCTVDELAEELSLNRSSVSRSLLRLLRAGLIARVREVSIRRAGRPKYIYKILDMNELENKVVSDVSEYVDAARKLVSTLRVQVSSSN